MKPHRKRTRRCEAGDGASGPAPSTSRSVGATSNPFSGVTRLLTWFVLLPREHMKCFICQSAVPVHDYGRHTDLCISRQDGASAAVILPKLLPLLLVLRQHKCLICLSTSRRRTCCRRWRKQTADAQVSATCDLRCWSPGQMFLEAHLWLQMSLHVNCVIVGSCAVLKLRVTWPWHLTCLVVVVVLSSYVNVVYLCCCRRQIVWIQTAAQVSLCPRNKIREKR